jgi:hypothetical protein
MNPITVAVGALICCYALWALAMRLRGRDDKFRKLEPMRQFWGDRLGSAIHYVGYVLVPLGVGIAVVFAGARGVDLLSLLKS